MTGDVVEMAVIVLLLFWNLGLTIWVLMLLERKHQLEEFCKKHGMLR